MNFLTFKKLKCPSQNFSRISPITITKLANNQIQFNFYLFICYVSNLDATLESKVFFL